MTDHRINSDPLQDRQGYDRARRWTKWSDALITQDQAERLCGTARLSSAAVKLAAAIAAATRRGALKEAVALMKSAGLDTLGPRPSRLKSSSTRWASSWDSLYLKDDQPLTSAEMSGIAAGGRTAPAARRMSRCPALSGIAISGRSIWRCPTGYRSGSPRRYRIADRSVWSRRSRIGRPAASGSSIWEPAPERSCSIAAGRISECDRAWRRPVPRCALCDRADQRREPRPGRSRHRSADRDAGRTAWPDRST